MQKAIVLDWAGTIIDQGNTIPLIAFKKAFLRVGMELTDQDILPFMGMEKKEHIKCILKAHHNDWYKYYGTLPHQQDVLRIYSDLEKFLNEGIKKSIESTKPFFIKGFFEIYNLAKRQGWKIGTTTGYSAEILNLLESAVEKQGVRFDLNVSSTEVEKGRPHPDMMNKILREFNVKPENCVKIGDTEVDVGEGENAGCKTIRVLYIGLPRSLRTEEYTQKLKNNAVIHPTFYTRTLKEVPKILKKLLL